jgi:hypothetical protein
LGAVKNVLCGSVPIVTWQASEIGIPIIPGGERFGDNGHKKLPVSNASRLQEFIQLDKLQGVTEVIA